MDNEEKIELDARRKGYTQSGVYVRVDVDARVITDELLKTWNPEDVLVVYEQIGEFLEKEYPELIQKSDKR
jgi:hypothetical protein